MSPADRLAEIRAVMATGVADANVRRDVDWLIEQVERLHAEVEEAAALLDFPEQGVACAFCGGLPDGAGHLEDCPARTWQERRLGGQR